MKKAIIAILVAVYITLGFVSCKEVVLPKAGKRVSKVTYSLYSNATSGTESTDYQQEYNSKAIVMPATSGRAVRVSSTVPVRKGYKFQYWTDGVNQYQPGDVFTEETVIAEDGSVHLEAVFSQESPKDSSKQPASIDKNYWRHSKSCLFSVTQEELMKVGLRTHSTDRKLGGFVNSNSPTVEANFVNFPGGYIWDVPNYTTTTQTTPETNPTYWHKEVVGLNQGPHGATALVENFALADTELAAGILQVALAWNEEKNKGYNFLSNSGDNNGGGGDDGKNFYSGVYYSTNSTKDSAVDRESAYDPVVYISFAEAVVVCNMLTQWYNEVKRPSEEAPLTFAYTKNGYGIGSNAASSNIIKDVNDEEIRYIGSKTVPGSSYLNPFSHVQGATGFRLPTLAEWMFAATVNPENDTDAYGSYSTSSYRFPSIIDPRFPSGGKAVAAANANTYKYAVCSNTNGYNNSYSSKEFGTSIVKGDRAYNAVGLYDMTGNVKELLEGTSFVSTTTPGEATVQTAFVPVAGAGIDSEAAQQNPGYITSTRRTSRSHATGIRLCRTISSQPVIY